MPEMLLLLVVLLTLYLSANVVAFHCSVMVSVVTLTSCRLGATGRWMQLPLASHAPSP
jgi:hypothetical protein